MHLIKTFLISLIATWALELPAAWIMGLRGRKEICLAALVNLLTNPAAVMLYLLGMPQIPIELAVVVAEAMVYRSFARERKWNIPNPWCLSLVCNSISWITGIVIGGST